MASEPDVNSVPTKVMADSLSPLISALFHRKYAYVCVYCCTSLNIPPSTIYSPLIPTSCLQKASTLLTCCLMAAPYVFVLPRSYIPSYPPTTIFFPPSPLKALYNHFKAILLFLFPPKAWWETSVFIIRHYLASSWSSHSLMYGLDIRPPKQLLVLCLFTTLT